jgi:putative membrane protein
MRRIVLTDHNLWGRRPMIERYSDHAANERTFLAWVRTAIAIMAFGFLVQKFDLFLRIPNWSFDARSTSAGSQIVGNIAGLLLILLGGVVMAFAAIRFRKTTRDIDSKEVQPGPGERLDITLVSLLLLLGTILFVYLVYTGTSWLWAGRGDRAHHDSAYGEARQTFGTGPIFLWLDSISPPDRARSSRIKMEEDWTVLPSGERSRAREVELRLRNNHGLYCGTERETLWGGRWGNGNFVASSNRRSAAMPQPNDPGLRRGRLWEDPSSPWTRIARSLRSSNWATRAGLLAVCSRHWASAAQEAGAEPRTAACGAASLAGW